MPQPKRWKDEVVDVLETLGGTASLREIYFEIEKRRIMHLSHTKKWHASVRNTIETFSSDSDNYNGKIDLFYSVDGLGSGNWGLR